MTLHPFEGAAERPEALQSDSFGMNNLQFRGRFREPQVQVLKRASYGRRTHFFKEERIPQFPHSHCGTKVTQSEFAELERAAAERGFRLSEWIREVLFRELRDGDHTDSGDHINYGKRLLTEIVGLQVFLTHVLSTMSRGEWLDAEQYDEITRQVKAKKHRWAQEILAEQPPDTRGQNESRPFSG